MELHGGRDREVAVEVNRDKMAAYKLTLTQIANAIRKENQLLPSGSVYTETTKADVRVIAQYKTAADIENVQVTNAAGAKIPLTSVATVKEQEARAERYGRLNGEDAINVLVYKNSDANVVATADHILKNVEKLRKAYPDYQFVVVSNDADYVQSALHSTMGTLVEGLITTGLVLFFFLRGWRSTAAVMIAIPTSLIATFFVMYLFGFTFNMMSLMGMTLCVGILVDDSIVVLENIVRHLKLGESPEEAAENGRTEIGMAAIAITLCDAAVFMPIAFMQGMTGQYFRQFGLTIVFAGLFSLFVSFTLTPMLASRFFRGGYHPPSLRAFAFMDRLELGPCHIMSRPSAGAWRMKRDCCFPSWPFSWLSFPWCRLVSWAWNTCRRLMNRVLRSASRPRQAPRRLRPAAWLRRSKRNWPRCLRSSII